MTHHIEFPSLGLQFDVNTTAFTIGSFSVQWYGILIATGFLLAILYASRMCKKMNISSDALFDCVIVGLICGVIGARLYYVIFYPGDKYINDPISILNIKEGGLGIYGGIIGGLLGGGIMAKIRKIKVTAVLDIASIGFFIGQAVGRWGNFINQEAFGTSTDLPWGMQSAATALDVVGPVHPCFLYESILCLLGFIFLHFFTRYLRRYDGQTFLCYLVWYGTSRFFIESLRTDSLLIPYTDLRVSQAVAAVTVLAAVVLLVVFARKTSLTGCGSKKVMELNGIKLKDKNDIFGDDVEAGTLFSELDTEDETAEDAAETTEEAVAEAEVEAEVEAEETAEKED